MPGLYRAHRVPLPLWHHPHLTGSILREGKFVPFSDIDVAVEGLERELLQRMSIEVPTIRPRVLSPQSMALLDELRAFRHVFQHSYSYSMDPQKVAMLQDKVLAGWQRVEEDIARFEEFLKAQLQA
ncbi:MAG: hypothetical protein KatS3mg023_0902 [Armatimonadota bacterium]|nr:MAG: hypothetical protein KatS3mg023_0902 [Armatimonadota bacterium]